MGKTKQMKEKKFDRNIEISAPILDPEIIKAIHTPPKSQRLDLKYGGFKALLSDLNSQDSTDELIPLNDNHVPSYIGISCAVSGYSNYSSYAKKSTSGDDGQDQHIQQTKTKMSIKPTLDRSRTASPTAQHHIHHITLDKDTIHSADQERKELTEKLTASANERRRSPSPCIPPTEDDRHHGAYVGARYCPLPPPSKVINKHIPLLGIDDDQDPDEFVEQDEHKVEQKIASLYGDNFVEDWRESMTHKAKKELVGEPIDQQQLTMKSPKDLVTLKPTPQKTEEEAKPALDIPTPSVKVLGNVDKQFLNKLLSDENPPRPSQSPDFVSKISSATTTTTSTGQSAITRDDIVEVVASNQSLPSSSEVDTKTVDETPDLIEKDDIVNITAAMESHSISRAEDPAPTSPLRDSTSPASPDSQIITTGDIVTIPSDDLTRSPDNMTREDLIDVSSPDGGSATGRNSSVENGLYYLGLLDNEKSFIREQIVRAEEILATREDELDEDTVGKIRSAIGKANLLVNKKCNQFKELCEANINESSVEGQFATLNDDLAGFWDMLSIQVSDVRKSFESLWEAETNNWQFVARKQESVDNEEKTAQTSNSGSKPKLSAQKDQERRERLQEHINQMKQNRAAKSGTDNIISEDSITPQLAADEQEEQMFSLMGGIDEKEQQQQQEDEQ